jgi:hypothetical protein
VITDERSTPFTPSTASAPVRARAYPSGVDEGLVVELVEPAQREGTVVVVVELVDEVEVGPTLSVVLVGLRALPVPTSGATSEWVTAARWLCDGVVVVVVVVVVLLVLVVEVVVTVVVVVVGSHAEDVGVVAPPPAPSVEVVLKTAGLVVVVDSSEVKVCWRLVIVAFAWANSADRLPFGLPGLCPRGPTAV